MDQKTREFQHMMRAISIGIGELVIIGVGAKIAVLANLFCEWMKCLA